MREVDAIKLAAWKALRRAMRRGTKTYAADQDKGPQATTIAVSSDEVDGDGEDEAGDGKDESDVDDDGDDDGDDGDDDDEVEEEEDDDDG